MKIIDSLIWVGGIMVQLHVIWSLYLSPIIYKLDYLNLQMRNLVSFFAYKFLFHIPQFIVSGISIFIQVNHSRRLLSLIIKAKQKPKNKMISFPQLFFTRGVISVFLKQGNSQEQNNQFYPRKKFHPLSKKKR